MPANESRAVLVDLHAPQGTPAGKYTGTLHVTGGVTQDVSVELTVWDFDVPSTSTLRTAFGMAWNGPCVGHGDASCGGGDNDLKLRARYIQSALDNHVSIHQPYFTSTVDASGNENWGAFDQYAGPFLDGTADTRLKGAKLSSVSVNGATKAAVVAAWSKHFKAKGWTDTKLFDYVCDEPPMTCQWSDIPGRVAEVHAGDPSMPTLVTTTTRRREDPRHHRHRPLRPGDQLRRGEAAGHARRQPARDVRRRHLVVPELHVASAARASAPGTTTAAARAGPRTRSTPTRPATARWSGCRSPTT